MKVNGFLTFSDLELGETFQFDHERMEFHYTLAHGPWVKTSPRKYIHTRFYGQRHAHALIVGTVKTRVKRGDSCGGLFRRGRRPLTSAANVQSENLTWTEQFNHYGVAATPK